MRSHTTAAITLFALLPSGSALAASCPGYSTCPAVNYPRVLASNVQAKSILAAITAKETASLASLQASGLTAAQFEALLGQTLVFDKTLSAAKNEACALCHFPTAGFADGVTAFTPAAGIFPGSVTTRANFRTPPPLSYSAFAPVLSLRLGPPGGPLQVFVGGTFWDQRATGLITGVPAADQAAAPFTNPLEMGLPDQACVLRRIALAPYAASFTKLWGAATLAITWPANTDALCATPNAGGNQTPLTLSSADRAQVATTLADIGLTIAVYETSPLASPFTSKFDAVQAGTATFTAAEQAGFALFTGAAHCSVCHAAAPPPGTTGPALFTIFAALNDGIPHNSAVPYLTENTADSAGYIANPQGTAFIDEGVGAFLASAANTNPSWKAQAANFTGTMQVPTLRNVAALASKGATRTYMHNGFFHRLEAVVHFYNTRDVLPVCTGTGTSGIGVTCWPAPEVAANENHIVGKLGLSAAQEGQIVAFLRTLTDGYGSVAP